LIRLLLRPDAEQAAKVTLSPEKVTRRPAQMVTLLREKVTPFGGKVTARFEKRQF